jgi:hypothetical protein
MRFLKSATILLSVLASSVSFASFDTTPLDLTFKNSSTHTLTYTGLASHNPGNVITVTPTVIPPNTTAEIVGAITQDFDLISILNFADDEDAKPVFFIQDPRQFRIMQPEFEMNQDSKYTSTVLSKTINPGGNTRDLFIIQAMVEINDA